MFGFQETAQAQRSPIRLIENIISDLLLPNRGKMTTRLSSQCYEFASVEIFGYPWRLEYCSIRTVGVTCSLRRLLRAAIMGLRGG
jgi:hypothetical protein